jgi:hypothetical protein
MAVARMTLRVPGGMAFVEAIERSRGKIGDDLRAQARD